MLHDHVRGPLVPLYYVEIITRLYLEIWSSGDELFAAISSGDIWTLCTQRTFDKPLCLSAFSTALGSMNCNE